MADEVEEIRQRAKIFTAVHCLDLYRIATQDVPALIKQIEVLEAEIWSLKQNASRPDPKKDWATKDWATPVEKINYLVNEPRESNGESNVIPPRAEMPEPSRPNGMPDDVGWNGKHWVRKGQTYWLYGKNLDGSQYRW